MKAIPFNINDHFLVRFTPAGFEHLQKKKNEFLPDQLKSPVEYYSKDQDENGYFKMQAWEFMKFYGETLRMGTNLLFDLNIQIEVTE